MEINKKNKPLVGIIMGSDSDLQVMNQASEFLDKNHVPYEMQIVSASQDTRTNVQSTAKNAKKRGLRIIIAADEV